MIEKSKLAAFFNEVESQEQRKKDISADIKFAFDGFSKEYGLSLKGLKRYYRDYKEYQKDPAAFVEAEAEADSLLQSVIPEYKEAE